MDQDQRSTVSGNHDATVVVRTSLSPGPVMNKRDALHRAVQLRDEGRLFQRGDVILEDVFKGSIDRFCEIAVALRDAHRVLDVGAGHGLLLSLLREFGHECHALAGCGKTRVAEGRYAPTPLTQAVHAPS